MSQPDYALLKRCGDFEQIQEWFNERYDIDMCMTSIEFIGKDGRVPRFEGLLWANGYEDADRTKIASIFENAGIDVIYRGPHGVQEPPRHFGFRFSFHMRASEWPCLLMMWKLHDGNFDFLGQLRS